jgi:heat-inducible transcriptional repressor
MAEVTLTERERCVLDAVIRTYVETAEPAGSRTVARRHSSGCVSRDGTQHHGRPGGEGVPVPSPHVGGPDPDGPGVPLLRGHDDAAARLTAAQARKLRQELGEGRRAGRWSDWSGGRRRPWVCSRGSLGVAIAPAVDEVVLERLELLALSSEKVLLVLTLRNGIVRTVYVDLPLSVPRETLVA